METTFSVLKRKFGGDLKARKFLIQMKEIASKIIVYNIHKFLLWFFIEVFYRAQIFPNRNVRVTIPHRLIGKDSGYLLLIPL